MALLTVFLPELSFYTTRQVLCGAEALHSASFFQFLYPQSLTQNSGFHSHRNVPSLGSAGGRGCHLRAEWPGKDTIHKITTGYYVIQAPLPSTMKTF